MIATGYYRYYNTDYCNDKIITIQHKHKNTENYIIINDEIKYLKQLCNTKVYNFKPIVLTKPLLELLHEITKSQDVLYRVALFDMKLTEDFEKNNVHIFNYDDVKEFEPTLYVTIIDSNIVNINKKVYNASDKLNIFSPGKKSIKNYIKIKYNDFNIYENFSLQIKKEPDMENQILSIVKYKTYDSKTVIKLLYHTLYYLNKYNILEKDDRALDLLLSCIRNFKQNKVFDKLNDSNISDKLFRKCYDLNIGLRNILCNNQFIKTFMANYSKIQKRENCKYDENEINKNKYSESLEFYSTNISLDSWLDAMNNKQCIGVLINSNCYKLSKTGIDTSDMVILSCNSTFITLSDLLNSQNIFMDKYNTVDRGGDLTSIMGNGIGSGNGILPIYINNVHWKSAVLCLEECISLSITQNSYSFKPIMVSIYEKVMNRCLNQLSTQCNYKQYNIFIGLLITTKYVYSIYDLEQPSFIYLTQYKNIINNSIDSYLDNNGLIDQHLYDLFKNAIN